MGQTGREGSCGVYPGAYLGERDLPTPAGLAA